jgi:hypothetical protein
MFADGAYDEIKWYKFTASASSLFIHSKSDYYFGSNGNVYIQLYDSNGIAVGGMNNQLNPIGVAVTSGNDYYIKTYTRYSPSAGYGDITHAITFSGDWMPPGVTPTPLTADVWNTAVFPQTALTQWFSFTATASSQYFHFDPGSSYNGLYFQVYDSAGTPVGDRDSCHGATILSSSTTVISGQTYYIKIDSSYRTGGTWRIAFNDSAAAPSP